MLFANQFNSWLSLIPQLYGHGENFRERGRDSRNEKQYPNIKEGNLQGSGIAQ